MLEFKCVHCGQVLHAPNHVRGNRAECANCLKTFKVPSNARVTKHQSNSADTGCLSGLMLIFICVFIVPGILLILGSSRFLYLFLTASVLLVCAGYLLKVFICQSYDQTALARKLVRAGLIGLILFSTLGLTNYGIYRYKIYSEESIFQANEIKRLEREEQEKWDHAKAVRKKKIEIDKARKCLVEIQESLDDGNWKHALVLLHHVCLLPGLETDIKTTEKINILSDIIVVWMLAEADEARKSNDLNLAQSLLHEASREKYISQHSRDELASMLTDVNTSLADSLKDISIAGQDIAQLEKQREPLTRLANQKYLNKSSRQHLFEQLKQINNELAVKKLDQSLVAIKDNDFAKARELVDKVVSENNMDQKLHQQAILFKNRIRMATDKQFNLDHLVQFNIGYLLRIKMDGIVPPSLHVGLKQLDDQVHKLVMLNIEEAIALKREIEKSRLALFAEEEQNRRLKEEQRKQKINSQFRRNGAHIQLEQYLLKHANDPDSYEHDSTSYQDKGTFLVVITHYRAKNQFGGLVKSVAQAHIRTEDGKIIGEVMDITPQSDLRQTLSP